MAKAKTKTKAALKVVKGKCTACRMFRATPGSKKNEQVDNLCCLTGNRKVIADPENFTCDSYLD